MRAYLIGVCLGLLLFGGLRRTQADIDCDGIDDLLTSAATASLFFAPSTFTVTAYLKSTGSVFVSADCWNEGPLIMDLDENVAVGRTGTTGTGAACGFVFDGAASTTVPAATSAGWQHIAVRLQGGTLELFVNGVSVATGATGPIADLSTELRLCGGLDGTSPDRITDVQTYNVAVPTAEITTLATSRLRDVGRTTPTAAWPLTDCTDGASGHGLPFVDRSGNGRTLTGNRGANAAGLTCRASEFVAYLWGAH